jgi:hypothetical protein
MHMKITYNVTGTERKALVAAISQELNTPVKYLGMPTAAYEVGDPSRTGGYHIDKIGTVTGADDCDLIAALRERHGFKAIGEEYDEYPDIDQHHPGRYADPNVPPTEEMIEHAKAWMEGQPECESAECAPCSDRLTIEVPLKGFTPEKLDNLSKLVSAKTPLLKAVLGADELPIEMTADTLRFPWFSGDVDTAHTQAYATLISLLCKTALQKKRVTAKGKDVEGSQKYAMRCFLLSLGFIGDEYKAARKILLSKLEGNSSWKNGKNPEVKGDE